MDRKKEMQEKMSRFHKIAEKLDAYNLDAMMVTSAPNRLYAAEFRSSAGMAIVTRSGSYFFTDSRYIEAAGKAITGAEIRQSTIETPMPALANEVIEKHNIQRLGFEEAYATVGEYNSWKEKLKCKELVPAAKLLEELRAVKEPSEIENLIAAQRIAEKALEETLEFIKIGRTEQEVSAFLQYRMLIHGSEKPSFEPIVVSGINSSMPHGKPSGKALEDGDFLTMDFGAMVGGYCSDMTRTVAIGHVTDEMDRVYHTVLAAQQAGIAAAKAGVMGKDIHAAAAKVISDAGYGEYFGHGFGHGLGIEVHENPGAGQTASVPLPAGAVISAEPGIYLPGRFGVRIEDVLILPEGGCMEIMKAPTELRVH